MIKKASSWLLPLLGLLFITAYIRSATTGVVYTDYIRLVLSYLPDAWSISPYMRADILTRIPINYIERLINVLFFHYSTTFDMIMGALGLTLAGLSFTKYAAKVNLSVASISVITLIWFSLGQWEMLTNGSGWVHFVAVAAFIYNYIIVDRIYAGDAGNHDEIMLYCVPTIVITLLAGPYCAVYAAGLVAAYVYMHICKKNVKIKTTILRIICVIIPLSLYLLSNHYAVYEYSGSTDGTLMQSISQQPLLLINMFIKSFAATVVGGEILEGWSSGIVILMGIVVIMVYIYTLYIGFKKGIYQKHLFPLICIATGVMNHVLVVASRWIFLNENYAMSSRYALQYQIGTMGIVLTLMIVAGSITETTKPRAAKLMIAICYLFAIGIIVTDAKEIEKAPYRQEHFIAMEEAAMNYDDLGDDELEDRFEYHDAARIREALRLLEDNNLNIYYKPYGGEQ